MNDSISFCDPRQTKFDTQFQNCECNQANPPWPRLVSFRQYASLMAAKSDVSQAQFPAQPENLLGLKILKSQVSIVGGGRGFNPNSVLRSNAALPPKSY